MQYHFNQFVLDTDLLELYEHDQSLHVEPQVAAVLTLLIENRGQLVAKEIFNQVVWEGRVVSDSSLNSCIRAARKLLGDDGKKQAYIRTIHKKGFSFVADVAVDEIRQLDNLKTSSIDQNFGAEHFDSDVHDSNTLNGDELMDEEWLKIPEIPSIAVLPFKNLSPDSAQDAFSDGITEDIITALSKISSMLVIAPGSVFTYKERTVDYRQVSQDLGVRYILEGSIRNQNQRIRVTAKLLDAFTGVHIWAEKYDRLLDDMFRVQDELMREIVVALDVELREGEQHRFWSSGTSNLEAWECVRMSASVVLGSHDGSQLDLAKSRIERALQLDPDYAIAWVMMGWIHQYYSDLGTSEAETKATSVEAMRECAERAIALDPNCADAYSVMSYYYRELKEYDLAMGYAEKSISLSPNHAENLISAGGTMTKAGDPKRGLTLVKKAMRVCPFYRPGFLRALAQAYRFCGRPEMAIKALKESIKRQPESLAAHVNMVSVLGELKRFDEAYEVTKVILEMAPDFSISAYVKGLSYKRPEDLERVEQGLYQTGLPI